MPSLLSLSLYASRCVHRWDVSKVRQQYPPRLPEVPHALTQYPSLHRHVGVGQRNGRIVLLVSRTLQVHFAIAPTAQRADGSSPSAHCAVWWAAASSAYVAVLVTPRRRTQSIARTPRSSLWQVDAR